MNTDDARNAAVAAHCHSIAVGYRQALDIMESSRDVAEARARICAMITQLDHSADWLAEWTQTG